MKKNWAPFIKKKDNLGQTINGPGPAISRITFIGLKSPKLNQTTTVFFFFLTRDMAGKQVAGDGLPANLAGMSKNQLYEIMTQMKSLIEQNEQQARQILIQNPLLTKALFQVSIFFFKFLNYVFLSYFWIKFSSIFLSCFFFALGAY